MSGSIRTSDDKEHWYVCGQCGLEQYAVIEDELPEPCIDCGWIHRELKKYDHPSETKLDLTNY